MRVIMIAIGSAGDVFPFIGIGQALHARGHAVTLCSVPVFRERIEAEGLSFAPVCDEATYRRVMGDPRLWDPRTSFGVLWQAIAGMLEPVYDYLAAQDLDDLVVVGSLWALGARIAQERYGFPYLSVQVSPSTLMSAHLPPVHPTFNVSTRWPLMLRKWLWRSIEYLSLDRTCAPAINALRSKVGLPGTVQNVFSQWMHAPDGVLCLFPQWFAPRQPDWPGQVRMCGFPLYDGSCAGEALDAELQAFLDAGPAPVVFTPGSTEHFTGDFQAKALAALDRVGARGVFLAGEPLADAPVWALHRPYAPMAALLPQCAGLVHPGGIGAMSQALAAGVGQLLLPVAHDQFDNAERLVRLGCGRRLELPLEVQALADGLHAVLHDPDMRAACQRARTLSSQGSHNRGQVVRLIEQCLNQPAVLRQAS